MPHDRSDAGCTNQGFILDGFIEDLDVQVSQSPLTVHLMQAGFGLVLHMIHMMLRSDIDKCICLAPMSSPRYLVDLAEISLIFPPADDHQHAQSVRSVEITPGSPSRPA